MDSQVDLNKLQMANGTGEKYSIFFTVKPIREVKISLEIKLK